MFPAQPPVRAPLYRQIEAQLRGRIESGELQPGDRLPSINDLRRQFGGVNHLTVRRALKHLTADGLVHAEQGRGTFVHRRVRRTGRAALVLPHLGSCFFLPIARGVQTALGEAGFKTLILETRWDIHEETDTLSHLEELSIDGAVIFPITHSRRDRPAGRFQQLGFPVVLVDRSLDEAGLPDAGAPGNDRATLCVLDALARRGLAVPGAIAVTGFNDLAEAATGSPPLTTARQPLERLGRAAALLLAELMDSGAPASRGPLPVELAVRETA